MKIQILKIKNFNKNYNRISMSWSQILLTRNIQYMNFWVKKIVSHFIDKKGLLCSLAE